MKKLHKKHKVFNDKKSRKISKKPRKKKFYPSNHSYHKINKKEYALKDSIKAPENLFIFDKSRKSLSFFNELRKQKNISKEELHRFISIDFSKLIDFDYSSICVIVAIIENLIQKEISFRGNYPKDKDCKDRIIKSGLLNLMVDNNGNTFKKSEDSELILIKSKKQKKLDVESNKKISDLIKSAHNYLMGEQKHIPLIRKVLLEICGNSLEWAGKNKQWLIGTKYEKNKVLFTVTDIGEGILNTLNRKMRTKIKETFSKDTQKLRNGFNKKYGSKSEKENRNKGLPCIKNTFKEGIIRDLKVLTNNVLLDFGVQKNDVDLPKEQRFKGTLYKWEITKESIININP